MSYARRGCDGSDVYVYLDGTGSTPRWICDACRLRPNRALGDFDDFEAASAKDMIAHLWSHVGRGQSVGKAIAQLAREVPPDGQ
jgi:hypothetical protein